jgi:phospholipid transport system substrate-binding protein
MEIKDAFLRFMMVIVTTALAIFCVAAQAQTTERSHGAIYDRSDPQDLISTATQKIQQELSARPMHGNDPSIIMDIVDRDILPYTDIRRTTQLAMGRYWRTATRGQQDEIVQQFQELLIRTYSGALGLLTPEQKFQYPSVHELARHDDAVVRTVAMYNGHSVEIDYRLYRTAHGWRVYDLNLLGVWLVQVYRGQFGDEIAKHGVSGLLEMLKERNAAPAGG